MVINRSLRTDNKAGSLPYTFAISTSLHQELLQHSWFTGGLESYSHFYVNSIVLFLYKLDSFYIQLLQCEEYVYSIYTTLRQ